MNSSKVSFLREVDDSNNGDPDPTPKTETEDAIPETWSSIIDLTSEGKEPELPFLSQLTENTAATAVTLKETPATILREQQTNRNEEAQWTGGHAQLHTKMPGSFAELVGYLEGRGKNSFSNCTFNLNITKKE